MKYLSFALAALSLVPSPLLADSPGVTFVLSPEAVYADAGSFRSIHLDNLNGEQGFVWLAPADVPFNQVCLYLGSLGEPVTLTGVTAMVLARGEGAFPEGDSNTFVASSSPTDFVVAPVADPDANPTDMQPHCFPFDGMHTLLRGHAYVFAFDLNAGILDGHEVNDGRYLSGYYYRSPWVTHQAYTGAIRDTRMWAGMAVPFELRSGEVPTPARASSVLFLPGIEGSRLYEKVFGIENRRWELTPVLSQRDARALYLDENGESERAIYTKEGAVIEHTDVPFAGFDIYRTFLEQLARMRADDTIADFSAFPYDWRADPEDVVEHGTPYADGTRFISDEVERLAEASPSGKVTIVGHSNGGLVAKALMRRLEREGEADRVDMVVLVDVPQLGTPEAIAPMLHGDFGALTSFGGVYLNKQNARGLAEHMPDAHALLPSDAYFSKGQGPVIDLERAPGLRVASGIGSETIKDASSFERFLTGRAAPEASDTTAPNTLRPALLDRAKTTHQHLDAWMPPAGVRVVEVAGWGLDTATGIEYVEKQEKDCTLLVLSCRTVTKLGRHPVLSTDGDGTVVLASQAMMGGGIRHRPAGRK
jgi:pimeloyl-ACP methyl ester carboxylesterase